MIECDPAESAHAGHGLIDGVGEGRRGEVVRLEHDRGHPSLGSLARRLYRRDRMLEAVIALDKIGAIMAVEFDCSFKLDLAHGETPPPVLLLSWGHQYRKSPSN